MDVPDLRLLGYMASRPMLRVVRLRDALAEPAPVSLDTGYALDDCIRRDGWLVFTPNVNVYGLPLPFGERPFRIATDTWVVATGGDPHTVWLHGRDSPTIAEYDGVARQVRREVELQDSSSQSAPPHARASCLDTIGVFMYGSLRIRRGYS